MKYCIWNNKGGIGKTFLSFCLSVEYAIKNPDKNVVAVDMCPQANLSEMILGGNGRGQEGYETLQKDELTVAHYIKARYAKSMQNKLGTESGYFIKVNQYNNEMPENLWLLCGDIDLDLCSRIVTEMGNMSLRGAWKNSRSLLLDLLQTFELNNKGETVFFIDCNPSFSTYTELAILSAERLIIPCTADFASMRGIRNVFKTLYGYNQADMEESQFTFENFSVTAKDKGMPMPKVHSFILNKSRTHDKKASSAYKAHAKKITEIANDYKQNRSNDFADELSQLVFNIKDGNTLVTVLNHFGLPLSKLTAKTYAMYDRRTQLEQNQIDRIREDMATVVDFL